MKENIYKELKSLGVSFESSFPKVKDVEFDDLPQYRGAHPCFYKGILFTNGESPKGSKGDILVHFLNYIGYKPKVVIIIDDRKDNIISLEKGLARSYPDIKFKGLEYMYGYTLPVSNVNEKEFQTSLMQIKQKALRLAI